MREIAGRCWECTGCMWCQRDSAPDDWEGRWDYEADQEREDDLWEEN